MPLRRLTGRNRSTAANWQLAALLAFTAGTVDVSGYLALRQFTSHMSGIVATMAADIATRGLDILLQPAVVLGFTALTLALPQFAGNSNPGFHGISQVFYEYTSAYANNGSGFEGLGDATYWWNLSCTAVLALGRFPALIIPLAVAALMARKRVAPEGMGTLRIESATFALTMVAVIVILTVLQFMPALVLGPVADHLSLVAP